MEKSFTKEKIPEQSKKSLTTTKKIPLKRYKTLTRTQYILFNGKILHQRKKKVKIPEQRKKSLTRTKSSHHATPIVRSLKVELPLCYLSLKAT
jgi:hypothetical protein